MIKFLNTEIVFEELPGLVTLAINITNCQNNCIGCHSAFLKENIGTELTKVQIDNLISKNYGINCICFMGEGNDKITLLNLAKYIKECYQDIKIAIYSGRNEVEEEIYNVFDYVKIGPYIEKYGPLNKKTTNQKLFKINNGIKEDITYMFWKRGYL